MANQCEDAKNKRMNGRGEDNGVDDVFVDRSIVGREQKIVARFGRTNMNGLFLFPGDCVSSSLFLLCVHGDNLERTTTKSFCVVAPVPSSCKFCNPIIHSQPNTKDGRSFLGLEEFAPFVGVSSPGVQQVRACG